MGIEAKTLHRWYKDYLSDFNPEGQKKLHSNDVKITTGKKETVIPILIVCSENVDEDMGIDEKLIGEDWYTLLSNRQTGKIALCGCTTKSEELQQAMVPLLPYMEKVKTITRDMASNYSNLCIKIMPKAIQIIDKFHVIKNLLEAQQAVRIRYRQQLLEQKTTSISAV